jgi:hypothetical protein
MSPKGRPEGESAPKRVSAEGSPVSRSNRDVLLVVLVLAIAGAGYWIWERFFSHGAQIDAMHQACLTEFSAGKDRVKSQLDKGAAAVPRNDPAAGIVKDISAGLGKVIDEFAGSLGEAACGALRDACTLDFDGQACRKARERYQTS